MSNLLHDVLRPQEPALRLASPPRVTGTQEMATPELANGRKVPEEEEESDEELVGVVSGSATPARASRPGSPTRLGASTRRAPGPLLLSTSKTDPFRRLNTELLIRLLMYLQPRELARCCQVCRKWCNSQAANFVWFRHRRNAALHEDLPLVTGTTPTWTKRESKQNWRREYAALLAKQREDVPLIAPFSRASSRPSSRAGGSPTPSGYQTPREVKEEIWAREAEGRDKPSKVEMREAYKELGGRKARVKGSGGWEKGAGRDRTAYGHGEEF